MIIIGSFILKKNPYKKKRDVEKKNFMISKSEYIDDNYNMDD